jgi:N-acetylmuramoyl-L-alanine amidase
MMFYWVAVLLPNISHGAVLRSIHSSALVDQARVVLVFDEMPTYRWFLLKNPSRLVIDFNQSRWSGRMPTIAKNRVFSQLRRGVRPNGGMRVVLELKPAVATKVFSLPKQPELGARLVIDMNMPQRFQTASKAHLPGPKPINRAIKEQPLKHKKIAHPTNPQQVRVITVVIDPGHGGKDPGASGARGTREKNVVLALAKLLQKELNQQPGFRAILTRNRDRFIPLRGRLAVARKYRPDAFISLHADAFHRRSAAGASVYALSEHGATSEAARWLAEKENRSDLVGGVSLEGKGNILRSVLLDLSQTATTTSSVSLGDQVLRQLKRVTKLHRKHVDQAAFVVLKSPDIPSILVEVGFLSNPREEARLRNRMHQRRLTTALSKGIIGYFTVHPPRHSYLEWLRRNAVVDYEVQENDGMATLAQRSGCAQEFLQRMGFARQLVWGEVIDLPQCRKTLPTKSDTRT